MDATPESIREFGDTGATWFKVLAAVGVVGIAGVVALGLTMPDHGRRMLYAYHVGYMFMLSICLGALFFVTLQHVVRAGWSVTVRRIAEHIAATLPLMGILGLPLVAPTLWGYHGLFEWADPAATMHGSPHYDHLLAHKEPYLNPTFFLVRYVVYFGAWTAISRFFLKNSLAQDDTGDVAHSKKMEKWAAPFMVVFALTTTFASFDFLMSLAPHWFSTIFGVYFFAGSVLGFFAFTNLFCIALQSRGLLTHDITIEHYHDLGKLMFGFLFFWGYIAFSQYMLIWYANIPEETEWFLARQENLGWMVTTISLLFLHFIVPFFFLLSRETKRNKPALAFFSALILVMHCVDIYWLIMPQYDHHHFPLGVIDLLGVAGMFGVVGAAIVRRAGKHSLAPVRDPRLPEALAFENV